MKAYLHTNRTTVTFLLVATLLLTGSKGWAQCWQQISVGWGHTVALKTDGTIWSWGANTDGQLGDGTNTDRSTPAQIGNSNNWKAVAAGFTSTFALSMDGSLWACGGNSSGTLGDGTGIAKNLLVRIGNENDWAFITSGGDHTMAIKTDGTLWGWGSNTYGQLGDNTTMYKLQPVQIGGLNDWVSVSAGSNHTLALKNDGTLWAWGWNNFGQLGDGTNTDKAYPMQVGNSNDWAFIATGGQPFSFAIKTDGTLWAWGWNNYGQLGDGTTINKNIPVPCSAISNVQSISAGNYHAVAITTNGKRWAWGRNDDGQLGDGTNISKSTPALINAALNWSDVTCGSFFTIGKNITESISGWGKNDVGQLGIGNNTSQNIPAFIGMPCATTIVNPAISLSTSWVNADAVGGQITVFGTGFTPNSSATIRITDPEGKTVLDNTVNTDVIGTLELTWVINSGTIGGNYHVQCTDVASNLSAPYRDFYVMKILPPAPKLSIIAPSPNVEYRSGRPIEIQWKDAVRTQDFQNYNIPVVNCTYNIEYSKDDGPFQYYTSKTIIGTLISSNDNTAYFTPPSEGNYAIRVYRTDNNQNADTSATITVQPAPDLGFSIERVWDNSAFKPNDRPVLGVAADGTGRFFFKVKKNSNNSRNITAVNISISDVSASVPNPTLVGKVITAVSDAYTENGNDVAFTSVTNNVEGSDNAYWFSYIAPDDFARNDADSFSGKRYVQATITVHYDSGPDEADTERIDIVRPPIMMVHGLGGDETTWDNFSFSMPNSSQTFKSAVGVFKAGIYTNTMLPSGSFDDNAKLLLGIVGNPGNGEVSVVYRINSFQHAIIEARNRGYACNRVDYICHSMGGCMLRTAINKYPDTYKPSVYSVAPVKNYSKGFVNKAITINTPHWGSPLADYASFVFPSLNLTNAILYADILSIGPRSWLSAFVTYNHDSYMYEPTPAVEDLRAKTGGVRFSATQVKNHMIAGKLYDGSIGWTFVDAIGIVIGAVLTEIFFRHNFFLYAAFIGYPFFDISSDGVVPISSQFSQSSETNIPTSATLLTGIDYFHIGVCDKPAVGNLSFQLLNKSIQSPQFANSMPANTNPGGLVYKHGPGSDSVVEYFDTTQIMITSCQDTVMVDSTMEIAIKLKDTTGLQEVSLVFQGGMVTSLLKDSNQVFSLKVNSNCIEDRKLLVAALYDSAGFDVYHYDEKTVWVKPDATTQQLIVSPYYKVLNPTEKYAPQLNAIHSAYVTNINLRNSELSFQVLDTTVIGYDSASYSFIAKDSGSTKVIFDYRGFYDTLNVYIVPRADLINMDVPLPVVVGNFSGTIESCSSLIKWESGVEAGGYFQVERSIDGRNYSAIGRVDANGVTDYSFMDNATPKGNVFYRLQVVKSDKKSYSPVLHLVNSCGNINHVQVFPNPTTAQVNITFTASISGLNGAVNMVDVHGNSVLSDNFITSKGVQTLNYNLSSLPAGVYLCRIMTGNEKVAEEKIVIVR